MKLTVRKYTWQGVFRYSWEGEVVTHDDEVMLLVAEWRGPGEPRVGEIHFEAGDRFLEYYYPGRAYAIWQVTSAAGVLKGWYCNIETPLTLHGAYLDFQDLLLDVLVYPDGRYTVLDREEFDQARASGLPAALVALAESALAEVRVLIDTAAAPFSFAAGSARRLETV